MLSADVEGRSDDAYCNLKRDWVEISQLQSLGIIIGILTVTIVAGGMVDNKGGVDHKRLSDVL